MTPAPSQACDDPRAPEILDIIARETNTPLARLVPDATIEALGIPSLDMVQTIFELELHFDIEIPVVAERSGAEFATVGELVAHVLAAVDRAHADRIGPARARAAG